jgi:hypothetical protein
MGQFVSSLDPADVARLLDSALATIRAEFSALPESVLSWHPAEREWCAKEVLGHLIEAERRGFAGRVRTILENEGPALEAWDQDAVGRARRDCEAAGQDLVAEFGRLREESIALVTRLRDGDLARGGHHPKVGFLRVADLLHEWVHHDCNHIRQLLANVQARAWPHMGNAQRFSAE